MEPTAPQTEPRKEAALSPQASYENLTDLRNTVAFTKVSTFHNPLIWDQMGRVAKSFLDSNFFPKERNINQIMVKLEAGYEMGMQAVESMNALYVVNGKVTIYGEAITKRLKQFGWKIIWVKSDERECTVKVEKEGQSYEESYTMEEAVTAGLVAKNADIYKKFPKDKLRWNALHRIVKFDVPEVSGNLPMKEIEEDIQEVRVNVIDNDTGKESVETIRRRKAQGGKFDLKNASKTDESENPEPKMADFEKTDKPEAVDKPEPRKKAKRKIAEEAKPDEAAHEGNAQIPIDDKAPVNGEDYVIDRIRILLKKTGRDETKLCEYFGKENLEAFTDEERKKAIEIIEADRKAEDEPKPDAFDQAFDDSRKEEKAVDTAKKVFYKDL